MNELYENYQPDERLSDLCRLVEKKTWVITLIRWQNLADKWRRDKQSEKFKGWARETRETKRQMAILDNIGWENFG